MLRIMDPRMLQLLQQQQGQGQPNMPQGGGPEPDADDAGGPSDGDADDATLKGPSDGYDAAKVDQPIAGYMGPEHGPFMCGRCEYFDGQGSCHIVKGRIDPNGCCNLFTPQAAGDQDQPDQQGDQEDQEGGLEDQLNG